MKKLTWQEFEKIMQDASKEGKKIDGVIVFKPESFDKEYSEESRSYEVSSGDKYWNPNMIGSSLYGFCLDGTDQGARLDWYMKAVPEDGLGKRWLVDYCYLLDDVKEEKTESIKTEDIKPDREYNGIKYFDNKDGWCPVCNNQLSYGVVEHIDGDMEYYPWECEKCGAKGEAWFKEVFQGHTVYNENNDGIDLPFNESKEIKTEDTDLYTNKTNLEKGFADEVIFHLESLANDGIEEAKLLLDDSDKVNEIVQELVNGCDDIWEDIHLRIEELAGINFRNEINKKEEATDYEDAARKISDISTEEIVKELVKDKNCDSRLKEIADKYKALNTVKSVPSDDDRYIELDNEAEKIITELAGKRFKVSTPFGEIDVDAENEEEAENKVKEAFRDGYKEKVKVIKNESLVSDAAARINQNDRYEGKEMQTEDGMLASKIAMVAEYSGDDYSEWLGDQEVKELIEEIKASDEYQNLNIKLNELIDELVQDKVDYIRKDEPASRYYTGEELDESKGFIKNKKTGEILTKSDVKERWKDQKEYFANNAGVDIKDYEYPFEKYLADIDETGEWEFINGEKVEEDYTQASNAGAIKVDIMGQPKKKGKKDKEDKALKSLPVQQVLIEGKDGEYREIEEKIEKEMYEYLEDNGIDLLDEELEFTEALKNKVEDLLIEFHTDTISEYMARYDENLMFDCDVTSDGKINVNVWSF